MKTLECPCGPSAERSLWEFKVVRCCEVEYLLKDLNPSQATGPEDISSTDLKLAAKNIAGTIVILFNELLQTGDLPDEFKLGHVVPILNPGKTDTSLPSSYRGITLTSIF